VFVAGSGGAFFFFLFDAVDLTHSLKAPGCLVSTLVSKVCFQMQLVSLHVGNTYERDAIERFWRTGAWGAPRRDPLTNTAIANCTLFSNWDKRREVQTWLANHPTETPEGWTSRDAPPPAVGGTGGHSSGGEGRGGGVDALDALRQPAASAALGLAVAAALGAIFVATTAPAPGGSSGVAAVWGGSKPHGSGSNPHAAAVGYFIPGGAHFMGLATPPRESAAESAAAAAAARFWPFGGALYNLMNSVQLPFSEQLESAAWFGDPSLEP
jgi:hypothetical protein